MAGVKIFKELCFDIKEVDETNHSFWATASTDEVDRDGDIIQPEAWDLRNFKKNPVIPLFHNYHDFPVAKAIKIKVEDNKLMFKPEFAVDIYPQAKVAFDLYANGYMSAFSVGFLPKEWSDETRKDGKSGRNYTKIELLEISAVLVPANANALVEARGKGIDVDQLEAIEDKDKDESIDILTKIQELRENTIIDIAGLRKEMAEEFVKVLLRLKTIEDINEGLSKALEAIIKPQTSSSKELFSAELKNLKQFTIK